MKELLGDRLKKLRKDLGYSQIEISKKLRISQHSFSNYENNKRFPDSQFLTELHSITGVSLNWLIIGTDGMYTSDYSGLSPSDELSILSKRMQQLVKTISTNTIGG
ncbi:MAG: helix-turn-helix transcriptional regulator [Candidatus Aminicenantes bacterium]|nr:helix-turn-helix transcriptional regulator [Candidatus Aminicenantes bacterium]